MRDYAIKIKGESIQKRNELFLFLIMKGEPVFKDTTLTKPNAVGSHFFFQHKEWLIGYGSSRKELSIDEFIEKFYQKEHGMKTFKNQKELFKALVAGHTIRCAADGVMVRISTTGDIEKSVNKFKTTLNLSVALDRADRWHLVEQVVAWEHVPAGTLVTSNVFVVHGDERFAYYDASKKVVVLYRIDNGMPVFMTYKEHDIQIKPSIKADPSWFKYKEC